MQQQREQQKQTRPVRDLGFHVKGTSLSTSLSDLPAAVELGATHARLYVQWRYIQPVLHGPVNATFTLDYVRAHPECIDAWAEDAEADVSWTAMDEYVNRVVAAGIVPIIEIGEGTIYGLPRLGTSGGKPADPHLLGEAVYLGHVYRYARATVRRYARVCSMWQIENELNDAWLEGLAGQRLAEVFDSPWRNFSFLTAVLATLHEAVKVESPSSQTTMNLQTDVSQEFHRLVGLDEAFYMNALARWMPFFDFVSIDAYPNMVISEPIHAEVVGERVARIRQWLDLHNHSSVSLIVMETGYPVNAPSVHSQYPSTNFTEALQAAYCTAVVHSIARNGGNGLVYFETRPSDGMLPPGGDYTRQDAEAFAVLGDLFLEDRAGPILAWLLDPVNWEYVRGRLPALVTQINGQGFGLVRSEDMSYRPALAALRAAFLAVL